MLSTLESLQLDLKLHRSMDDGTFIKAACALLCALGVSTLADIWKYL